MNFFLYVSHEGMNQHSIQKMNVYTIHVMLGQEWPNLRQGYTSYITRKLFGIFDYKESEITRKLSPILHACFQVLPKGLLAVMSSEFYSHDCYEIQPSTWDLPILTTRITIAVATAAGCIIENTSAKPRQHRKTYICILAKYSALPGWCFVLWQAGSARRRDSRLVVSNDDGERESI